MQGLLVPAFPTAPEEEYLCVTRKDSFMVQLCGYYGTLRICLHCRGKMNKTVLFSSGYMRVAPKFCPLLKPKCLIKVYKCLYSG